MGKIYTKTEAIALMKKGVKMTHEFFSPYEWAIIKDELMYFEDGCSCTQSVFWNDRRVTGWETGWKEWTEPKKKSNG